MNEKIAILVIEDEPEVLNSILRDLKVYESKFLIEGAQSADDAKGIIKEFLKDDVKIGLILSDHAMPGQTGVELLVELHKSPQTRCTRKVLVTAQAGLDDTVTAINEASICHFISKPWTKEKLLDVVKKELTQFVISNVKDLLFFMPLLDSDLIMNEISQRGQFQD